MLDVDKDELKKKFGEEDWEYVFDKTYKIAQFILSRSFKIWDPEKLDDMKQECAMNLFTKIQKGKVDPNNNIFAFIWKNSTFRILEILRKEANRKRIVSFINYDLVDYEIYKYTEVNERYSYESIQE